MEQILCLHRRRVVKPAHGAAVSWHQDGVTHWEHPDLDSGTHGFNFMAQLYPTDA